jgi:UDP-N-acetylmuramoylalanine--D-glutamate ligase
VLNVAPDHLDWWGGSFEDYAAAKGLAFAHPNTCAVGNADDPHTTRLIARAPGRRVTFTLASPRPGQLGIVGDSLVDRAFVDRRDHDAVEIASLRDVTVPGPHNVANALAAAALARAFGAAPTAIAHGLRTFTPAGHRIADVGEIDGVRYVDDSKATSPHAASASLSSFASVVWVAGGLGKDIPFDDLVVAAAPRLRGAVVFGACRAQIRDAIARHAPDVPVVEVDGPQTSGVHSGDHATNPEQTGAAGSPADGADDAASLDAVVDRVVTSAAALARPGDVVLLAPAAASMDMFRDYAHRGDAFAAAVARLRASGEHSGAPLGR